MDPATLGLIGTLGQSVIGGLFNLFGGSGRKTQDNTPVRPPAPEWKGMDRQVSGGAQPQLQDPGSRQAYQDPNIRLAALDQFRQKLGV